jgi:hypothetical protein
MSLTCAQLDILLANGTDAATLAKLFKCDIVEREQAQADKRAKRAAQKRKERTVSHGVATTVSDNERHDATRDARTHVRVGARAGAILESYSLELETKDSKSLEITPKEESMRGTIPKPPSESLFELDDIESESPPRHAPHFARFYEAYPKHVHRKAACSKFETAVKAGVDPERIISAARRYAEACRAALIEKQFIPAPDRWLHAGSYDDEDLPLIKRMNGHHDPPIAGRSNGMRGFHANVQRMMEEEMRKDAQEQGDGSA